ncbi:hypothetical protein N8D74_04425 [Curtobacterium flaccumfaciens]|uniref:Uncharacterized protein n=1 Tax=Curtobacterium poinsettiae TaxID=159612 RepID=A0A9Q9P843_9MICO|nr:hypothetical protein [Curtobacterium flaccumfaciens]UXN26133.1 hypothetical protein N8D74_04425 [Curtobacterium flaccumfaciens]UYC80975.1 hypothetical protein OE229_00505 [Curtobacterium flaccumfaciens pv. poinsettiae]
MMLLTTDWHPWFSYEWWNDIGVPALGALGSIAVGAGAIAVALHSNRIAQSAAEREAAVRRASEEAGDRAARGDFADLVTQWSRAEVRERLQDRAQESKGKTAGVLREEIDLKAALVGQHSEELVRTLSDRLKRVPHSSDDTSEGQAMALLWHRYSRPAVRSWVADADRWLAGEQEDRVSMSELHDLVEGVSDV